MQFYGLFDTLRSWQQRRSVSFNGETKPSFSLLTPQLTDYQVAESLNLELDYNDETSDFRNTTFPARYIYERLLPAAVAKCSDIYYHRSSPYSGYGKPTTDKTFGDLHQCELYVWLQMKGGIVG